MSGSGAYRRALGCGFSLNDPLPTALQTAPTNHAAGDAWYLRRILIGTPNEAELCFENSTGSAYFSTAKMRKRSPATHLGNVFEYRLDLGVILVRDCIIYLINITQRCSIIKLQQVKKFWGLFQLKSPLFTGNRLSGSIRMKWPTGPSRSRHRRDAPGSTSTHSLRHPCKL
jgi:hypothetical protein